MSRLLGILKVALVMALDFLAIYSLFEDLTIASILSESLLFMYCSVDTLPS